MDAPRLAWFRDTSTVLLLCGIGLSLIAVYNYLMGVYGGVLVSSFGAILAFTIAILLERS